MSDRGAPRPALSSWTQSAQLAQAAFAAALTEAITERCLDRARYQHWLALESDLCRIDAMVLERLADWHGAQPQLRATALGWATSLRADALAAAADVRALDGVAPPPPPQVARWHAYVDAACGSPRAGEALGTVLLHAGLLQGPAREALQRAQAWPWLACARSWLLRRSEPDPVRAASDRRELLDAWPAAALAAGAQRAAVWHREALRQVFDPQAPGLAPRMPPGGDAPVTHGAG